MALHGLPRLGQRAGSQALALGHLGLPAAAAAEHVADPLGEVAGLEAALEPVRPGVDPDEETHPL